MMELELGLELAQAWASLPMRLGNSAVNKARCPYV